MNPAADVVVGVPLNTREDGGKKIRGRGGAATIRAGYQTWRWET